MPALSIRTWFQRTPEPAIVMAAAKPMIAAPKRRLGLAIDGSWTSARVAVTDALWGEGFQFPGGEPETIRLVRPLGLASASNFLLVGSGGGGPACALAGKLGLSVGGFEADAGLTEAAAELIRRNKLSRQAQVATWDPAEPELGSRAYHHGMALEPLRGHKLEPTLAALAQALKPGGQFTLVELVADEPLENYDPDVADWTRLEPRPLETLPTELAVTRVLGRLGFEVRSTEDLSQRHMQQAIIGWRRLVRSLGEEGAANWCSDTLVREAELWTARLRLFGNGRLRLVRWHLVARATA